ncbi:MAG: OB-fold domain-containing protein [Sphingomonadales bacterium]|nr:OB-fold domain-containing protein [Sphingomonadales bacterium]
MQPIAEGLFITEPDPSLIGGRHRASGRIVFPCPPTDDFEPVPLGREGTLWSWTVQRFRPKSPPYAGPEAFAPWAVGYVELPGETIVEARLVNVALDALRIGMPLRLTLVPLEIARGGGATEPVLVHAFEPAGEPA